MENEPCQKHPDTITSWKCKSCGKPICPQCALPLAPTSTTRFCSENCKTSYVEYQEWLTHGRPQKTFWKTFSLWAWTKQLIGVAVLLFIIWIALFFVSGSLSPLTQLKTTFDLIGNF